MGGTTSPSPVCKSVEVGGEGAGTVWQVPLALSAL